MADTKEPISNQELKSCPGCGSMDIKKLTGDLTGQAKFLECQCGWAGPIRTTHEEAIEAWNRRAAPSSDKVLDEAKATLVYARDYLEKRGIRNKGTEGRTKLLPMIDATLAKLSELSASTPSAQEDRYKKMWSELNMEVQRRLATQMNSQTAQNQIYNGILKFMRSLESQENKEAGNEEDRN